MWPRTTCSLSSLTLNIVLGRASTTSPSISIFSSLPIGAAQGSSAIRRPIGCLGPFMGVQGGLRPARLAALEGGFAGALLEKRLDRVVEVLCLEQRTRRLGRLAVGLLDPAAQERAHDP